MSDAIGIDAGSYKTVLACVKAIATTNMSVWDMGPFHAVGKQWVWLNMYQSNSWLLNTYKSPCVCIYDVIHFEWKTNECTSLTVLCLELHGSLCTSNYGCILVQRY